MARRDTSTRWEAYTPYELRSVGTLVRMGHSDRARRLLEGFMADQYPAAWNQWPEVVWREPRAAKFLGDLPHTWVASDFLRSVADIFVYRRHSGCLAPGEWSAGSRAQHLVGAALLYGPAE